MRKTRNKGLGDERTLLIRRGIAGFLSGTFFAYAILLSAKFPWGTRCADWVCSPPGALAEFTEAIIIFSVIGLAQVFSYVIFRSFGAPLSHRLILWFNAMVALGFLIMLVAFRHFDVPAPYFWTVLPLLSALLAVVPACTPHQE